MNFRNRGMKKKIKKAIRLLVAGEFKECYSKTLNYFAKKQELTSCDTCVPPKTVLELLPLPSSDGFSSLPILDFPIVNDPEVTIVIPVFNKFEYTYNCLKSILNNVSEKNYKILIADDNSTDETKKLETFVKNIEIRHNTQNKGFLRNINEALGAVDTPYALLLNNDVQVLPNWFESLLSLIKAKDDAGIVGSKLLYPDGTLQEAGGIIYSDGLGSNYGKFKTNASAPEFSYVKECDYISGCSLLIKKELWDEIGGFDENFAPAYYEDADFCFEARKKGYKTYLQPESMLVHFEGISHGRNLKEGVKKYQAINLDKFKKKWGFELSQQVEHDSGRDNLARDRSFNKKKILFIDDSVPQFDTNAGHRTSFQYLKLLVEQGFSITFMSLDGRQPQPYTSILQQLGVEVLYSNSPVDFFEKWWEENKYFYNFAYITRINVAEAFMEILRKSTNTKIIFNICDLNYLRVARQVSVEDGPQKESKQKELDELKANELNMCSVPDCVLTVSTVEKQILKNIGIENVRVTPVFYFEEEESKDEKGLLFVGGFNHTPNVDGIIWFCKEVLPLINKKVKKQPKVLIVGSNPTPSVLELANEQCIVTGYVSDYLLDLIYKNKFISIIPLRYGAGIKGKVAEAMHHGLPVVSTSIGIEGMPDLPSQIQAFDSADEFAAQVLNFLKDDKSFEAFSRLSKDYSRSHYSKEALSQFMRSIFN